MFKKKTRNTLKRELHKKEFRVTIFGSARLRKGDKVYEQVFDLAKEIGKKGYDIVTGGGPGLMEAGNAGHHAGDKENKADSIGLIIKLPWEPKNNTHLEIHRQFDKFSNRLDTFVQLSHIFVVMPGGIGTCLELFYTWQLIQVKHVKGMPIILVGKMWEELINWVKKHPLKAGLISKEDLDTIHIAKDNAAAMKLINREHKKFIDGGSKSNKYL